MINQILSGKTALVCGGSQGIGLAIAQQLAKNGAQVCLLARSADKLQDLVKTFSGDGHQAFSCDLRFLPHYLQILKNESSLDFQKIEFISKSWDSSLTEKEHQLYFSETQKLLGVLKNKNIEILINNAGGPPSGPLIDADKNIFESAFSAHVLASQSLLQALVPGMKASQYGRVINIISTSVKTPLPNLGVSNTIRGAMASWSKSMANELGPFGITVNNILPGFTNTPRLETLKKAAAKNQSLSEQQIETQWKNQIPARRFAQPEEVAFAAAFLASPQASYINGINLPVDGGRTPSL